MRPEPENQSGPTEAEQELEKLRVMLRYQSTGITTPAVSKGDTARCMQNEKLDKWGQRWHQTLHETPPRLTAHGSWAKLPMPKWQRWLVGAACIAALYFFSKSSSCDGPGLPEDYMSEANPQW